MRGRFGLFELRVSGVGVRKFGCQVTGWIRRALMRGRLGLSRLGLVEPQVVTLAGASWGEKEIPGMSPEASQEDPGGSMSFRKAPSEKLIDLGPA
jgi:hypothetical protein